MSRSANALFLFLTVPVLVSLASAQTPPTMDAAMSALLSRGLSALGVTAGAGFEARGTASINGPNGTESGPVEIEVWGADHCKITIDFSFPGRERRYAAVSNGAHLHASADQGLAMPVLLLGPAMGCALLPQGLPWPALTGGTASALAIGPVLTGVLDAATGFPASVEIHGASLPTRIEYSEFGANDGLSFPHTIRLVSNRVVRLEIRLSMVGPHAGFTDADFVVPPSPHPSARLTHGGGR